ncbi:MAG: DUF1318 domain-containing protein [Gammaproteobacteria bacterium]|nr:DUF1318 domain-containing protein [Gammaproteobacteria bacterium]
MAASASSISFTADRLEFEGLVVEGLAAIWSPDQAAGALSLRAARVRGLEATGPLTGLAVDCKVLRIAGDVLLAALDFVIPAAHAQADIDISSPAIRALTASMRGRAAQLDPFFTSGAVGLTADGLVEVRDANAVALADRNKLKKLVADENADRGSLYREIATANGNPGWEADIRSTFAERWIANARTGWYYKTSAGAWQQK